MTIPIPRKGKCKGNAELRGAFGIDSQSNTTQFHSYLLPNVRYKIASSSIISREVHCLPSYSLHYVYVLFLTCQVKGSSFSDLDDLGHPFSLLLRRVMINQEGGLVSLFNLLLETVYHGLPASGAPTGLVLFRSLSTQGGSHLAHP